MGLIFRFGIRSEVQNHPSLADEEDEGDEGEDDDEDGYNILSRYDALSYEPVSSTHTHRFFRTVEGKEFVMGAYKKILKLVPKLKDVLPYQANADSDYIYKVIDAVCSAHILTCHAITGIV
jgi:hypothetical protein